MKLISYENLTAVVAIICLAIPSSPFVTPYAIFRTHHALKQSPFALPSTSSDSDESSRSRIAGNQRPPTASEIAVMDEMITKLADAKPYELPNAVSRAIRVVSSPRFFLRIAERADLAKDPTEKEKLNVLANNLVSTIEAVVSTADDRMEETSKNIERILKAASEPDTGEFLVPLSKERAEAIRVEIRSTDSSQLDEGFLSTVDTWIKKSSDDGLDGMVVIMQKLLQGYAGVEIRRARSRLQAEVGAAVTGRDVKDVEDAVVEARNRPAAVLLDELLEMDSNLWDSTLNEKVGDAKDISKPALMGEVQRTMEGVILGLENGSMAQRVQAEFIKELVSRIENV